MVPGCSFAAPDSDVYVLSGVRKLDYIFYWRYHFAYRILRNVTVEKNMPVSEKHPYLMLDFVAWQSSRPKPISILPTRYMSCRVMNFSSAFIAGGTRYGTFLREFSNRWTTQPSDIGMFASITPGPRTLKYATD
jgi:hypothetical protein